MTTIIYGIKNCDTMKKAFKWLDENNIEYIFYDYKKENVDEKVLRSAIKKFGWEEVLNKRGTTWRQLPKKTQSSMNNDLAIDIAIENPSIIKRPLLVHEDQCILGFKKDTYSAVLK